jgi:hypothetical protein
MKIPELPLLSVHGVMQEDRLVGDFDVYGVDQMRTIKQYIKDEFGFEHSFRWPALGIELAHVIVMRFVIAIATKYLQWQKR